MLAEAEVGGIGRCAQLAIKVEGGAPREGVRGPLEAGRGTDTSSLRAPRRLQPWQLEFRTSHSRTVR